MRDKLRKEYSLLVGHKLIKRYLDEMGNYAIYSKPNLSKHGNGFKPFPYLLKNKAIFLGGICSRKIAAQNVASNLHVTQSQVDSAVVALSNAIDGLVLINQGTDVDKTAIDAPIEHSLCYRRLCCR